MIKTLAGLIAVGLVIFLVKSFLSPLPPLSVSILMQTPIEKLTLLFEAAVVIVLVGGFIFQELLHLAAKTFNWRSLAHDGTAARWSDLLYVLVGIFGSAALYVAFISLSDLGQADFTQCSDLSTSWPCARTNPAHRP